MLSQTMVTRNSSRQPAERIAPSVAASVSLGSSIEMMGAAMPFARNAEIYGENEPADYLYKVISGAVRTYKVLNDGRRQIGSFYLPGDIFGLEVGDAAHLLGRSGCRLQGAGDQAQRAGRARRPRQ